MKTLYFGTNNKFIEINFIKNIFSIINIIIYIIIHISN